VVQETFLDENRELVSFSLDQHWTPGLGDSLDGHIGSMRARKVWYGRLRGTGRAGGASRMTEIVVSVRELQTTFHTRAGPVRAVDGISYDIGKGRTLGIVGESGCGKSVTSYSVMRLIEPPGEITGGAVLLHGEDLLSLPEERMQDYRGARVAMIFQEPMTALNPVLTIGYQMDEQIMRHMGLTRRQSRERALEMLELVGIPAPRER